MPHTQPLKMNGGAEGGFSVDETVMDSLAFWFVCFRDPKLIIHVPVFLYCRQSPWQTTKTPFSEFPLGCNGTVLHHRWWLKVFRWLQLDGSTTAICLVEFHWRVSKLDFIGENLLVVLIKKVIITYKKYLKIYVSVFMYLSLN